MSSVLVPPATPFVDRRDFSNPSIPPGVERRQFANSYSELSPEARELGEAIDRYKLLHRRRFINYEEMLALLKTLGYRKDATSIG
jgi:hypothetical protein